MSYYESTEVLQKRLRYVIDNAWEKLRESGLNDAEIDSAVHGRMDALEIAGDDDTPTPEYLFVSLLMDCKRLQDRLKKDEPEVVAGYVMAAETQCKELSQLPLTISGFNSKNGGAKGGKNPKRRQWADAVAQYLLENHAGLTKKAIWETIGDSANTSEIETDFEDVEFYKDGEKLCAIVDGEAVTPMGKAHFFNEYLKTKKPD